MAEGERLKRRTDDSIALKERWNGPTDGTTALMATGFHPSNRGISNRTDLQCHGMTMSGYPNDHCPSEERRGVRGIATGTSFRRLVSKTLARQFMTVVEETCVPFQFALSTRAGTDCVGHAIRVATDANHEAIVLSIDGVGAYDHVHRSAMLSKLLEVPRLQPLYTGLHGTRARRRGAPP